MNTLQIILQRRNKKTWPVVAMETREKENLFKRNEGTLDLDLTGLLAASLPREYGKILGHALIRDEIRDAYEIALTHARGENECLHVLLTVEDPELSSLHWERLCEPVNGHWDFISLNQDTPFSIDLPARNDRSFPPMGKRDLLALALIAGPQDLNDPYGLPVMDPAAAAKMVRVAFGSIPCDILATPGTMFQTGDEVSSAPTILRVNDPPNLNKLCELLTAGRYTILHILCHGQYARNEQREGGEMRLYLPGDNNRPVTGSELIERLGRVQGQRGLPQFVFLMACEGGSPEAENGLGGLAQRMVRELGIPAVLAMTSPVSMVTADLLARKFYRYLCEHGEPDRALVEALAGLQGQPDVTVPAIFSRLRGKSLFTDMIDRKLEPADLQHGAGLLSKLIAVRAPVLQNETDALAIRLKGLQDTQGISAEARRNREAVLEKANQLSQEILDISFNALALDQLVTDYDARCPFRGLYPFGIEDREFFFGREALLDGLTGRLEEYPFLAILGASGSGKSSLVRAGLLPRLDTCGETICITPGGQPVAQLGTALTANPNCTALIVDQFEEIFTLCHDETQRQAFIEGLLAQKENRRIILAMRADFWGECAPYTRLKEEIECHQELLAPLDIPGLRRVMEQQAAQVGLRFEGGLAEMILDDVTNEPGAMCLLQHALLLLWERRHGRLLCAKEYKAIGGVDQAIARSADKVFNTFNEAEKERVRDIFLRLTRVDLESAAGQEHRDTRRRVELRELVPAGGDQEAITNLVARLADGRLVVTSSNRVTNQDEVEVAHEALIRHWPLLRNWLEEDRAGLRLRESIHSAALTWEKSLDEHGTGNEDWLIHRGLRLDEALELRKKQRLTLNEQEQRYLDACLALREKAREAEARKHQEERAEEIQKRKEEKRRRNELLVFMGIVTAVMVLLASLSYFSARKAAANQQVAERAVTAQAQTLRTVEAARSDAETARNDAVEQKAAAEASRQEAVNAQATAEVARKEAEEGRAQIISSKEFAQQQAEIARARELAALSMAHQGDNIDLALLLAVEGWTKDANFDTQNALLSGVMSSFYVEQILPELTGAYPVVIYNQAGTRLAAAGSDGKVYLLDTATNQLISVLESGATRAVASLAFSPSGVLLASSDETGISLWDGASGKRIDVLPASDSPQIVFYDEKTLYASSDTRMIRFWDIPGKKFVNYYTYAPARKVLSFVVSPLGQPVVGTEHGVYLWLLPRWKLDRKWVYVPINGPVRHLSFSPGGLTLAASEEAEKRISLWDNGGHLKNRINVNTANVQMTFKPDGLAVALAYAAADNSIMLVDPLTGKALQPPMKGHVGPVNALAFGPNGQLATDGEDRFILWNSQTDQQYTRSLEAPGPIRTFAISADGKTLAEVGKDNVIRFYPIDQEPGDPAKVKDQFKPDHAVRSLAISQNGLLAVGSDDRLLFFGPQHLPEGEISTGWKATQVLFSSDGKTLAAADPKNGLIQAWDVASLNKTGEIQTKPFISFALTSDGRFLVTTWEKGHVQVGDAQSRQIQFDRYQVAQDQSGDALDSEGIWAEINPNGDFLFIHDYLGGVVRVFYIPTQQQVYELTGWAVGPGDQAVSPDGFMSVSRSSDRTFQIMSLDPVSLKLFDCQKAGRNITLSEWKTFFPNEEYRKTCPQWDAEK